MLFKLKKFETLELLLNFILKSLYKTSVKVLTVLNLLLISNEPLMLNIVAGLETVIRLNITMIMIGILVVIIRTFETINNAVIITEVTRISIIIIVCKCVLKLTFEMSVIVVYYVIIITIITIIKRE